MNTYMIMPEHGRFYTVEAATPEAAFRGACCWYKFGKPIGIMDTKTGNTVILKTDKFGNVGPAKLTA